jgi:hypothetical protein
MAHNYRQSACDDCGKALANESALFAHQRRFCKNARRGINEALADARAYWRSKVLKRPRPDELEGASPQDIDEQHSRGEPVSVETFTSRFIC